VEKVISANARLISPVKIAVPLTGSWSGTRRMYPLARRGRREGRKGAWISHAFAFRAHAHARGMQMCTKRIPLSPHLPSRRPRHVFLPRCSALQATSRPRRSVGRSVGRSIGRSPGVASPEESRVSLRRMNKILFSRFTPQSAHPNHRGAAEEFAKREGCWIKSRDLALAELASRNLAHRFLA